MSNPRPLIREDSSDAGVPAEARGGLSTRGVPGSSVSAAPEILGYFRVFVSDGILDEGELRMIENLALRDGVVDSKERAVLSRIFDRIDPQRLDGRVKESIQRLRDRHGIR